MNLQNHMVPVCPEKVGIVSMAYTVPFLILCFFQIHKYLISPTQSNLWLEMRIWSQLYVTIAKALLNQRYIYVQKQYLHLNIF